MQSFDTLDEKPSVAGAAVPAPEPHPERSVSRGEPSHEDVTPKVTSRDPVSANIYRPNEMHANTTSLSPPSTPSSILLAPLMVSLTTRKPFKETRNLF